MPSYHVDVEPNVLVWARISIGMSREEAADKLRVSVLTLRFWEEGAYSESQPTLVQLRRMAEIYGRPIAAFYLSAPPAEPTPQMPDFRLLTASEAHSWSLSMHETYRRVLMQREVAIELAQAADEPGQVIGFTVHKDVDAEIAAETIRSWLGIEIENQVEWRQEHRALNSWIAAVENHDILVAHSAGVSLQEMRGFAISEDQFPLIVLNGFDAPRGRIFTLVHELVHLVMQSGGLCNLKETYSRRSSSFDVEAYCNRVAGAVLLPREEVMKELKHLNITESIVWPEAALHQWANRYQVSREVILRRFVTLGFATLDQYFRNLRQYNRQYKEKHEREVAERERRKREGLPKPRPNPIVLRVRNLGLRYTSDVLRAYGRHDINAAELSEYLETKVDHIPAVVSVLERKQ